MKFAGFTKNRINTTILQGELAEWTKALTSAQATSIDEECRHLTTTRVRIPHSPRTSERDQVRDIAVSTSEWATDSAEVRDA